VCRKGVDRKGLNQSVRSCLRYLDGSGQRGGYPLNPECGTGLHRGLCDAPGPRNWPDAAHPDSVHLFPTQHPQLEPATARKAEGRMVLQASNSVGSYGVEHYS